MPERDLVLTPGAVIEYEVRRSRRRKKTLQITLDASGIVVATPLRTPASEVQAFVRQRAAWILRHAADAMRVAVPRTLTTGETVPYLGREARLCISSESVDEPAVQFNPWRFDVTLPIATPADGHTEVIRDALIEWYRLRAGAVLRERVDMWWARLGDDRPTAPRVLIRDQLRRWGSCTTSGTIRLNWRLVMAAPALIDYVVVHELAHLRAMNHSSAFWAHVAAVIPDYRERRARLREVGPTLRV